MYFVYDDFNSFSDAYIDKLVEEAPDQIYIELISRLTPEAYTSNLDRYDNWVSAIMERAEDELYEDELYEDDFKDVAFEILYLLFKTSGFTSVKCIEHLNKESDILMLKKVSKNDIEFQTLLKHSNLPGILIQERYKLLPDHIFLAIFPAFINNLMKPGNAYTKYHNISTAMKFVTYTESVILNNISDPSVNLVDIGCLSTLLDTPNIYSSIDIDKFSKMCKVINGIETLIFKDSFKTLYYNAQMLGVLQNPDYWKSTQLKISAAVEMPHF